MAPTAGSVAGREQAHRPSTLRFRLRDETAALHADLERQLDLLSPDLTLDRYVRVLDGLHRFYVALEPRLASLAHRLQSALSLKRRAPLLERDLGALGRAACGAPAGSAALPRLLSEEQFAGCIYVIEGAALGGRVIARAVRRLGISAEHGCAFFTSDGEDVAVRWAAVLRWLEEAMAQRDHGRVIDAASETFRTLGESLSMRQASR